MTWGLLYNQAINRNRSSVKCVIRPSNTLRLVVSKPRLPKQKRSIEGRLNCGIRAIVVLMVLDAIDGIRLF